MRWKKFFLYRVALHELKNCSFPQTKKFFVSRKLYELHSKPFLCTKTSFGTCLSLLISKTAHFHKPKAFLLHKPLRTVRKSRFFIYKKLFFCTNLSLFPSKASLFHPPLPISTPLNLLFAKNTAVLLISVLNSYAVKPEPRTDSNHCRRYPTKLQLFTKPVTRWTPVISEKITYRPAIWIVPGVQRFANLWCAFWFFLHNAKRIKPFPFWEAPRFCKPRIGSPQPQLRTATIKTF